ncbi:CopG family transcriptional regulator [Tepidimonas taiwanensis]|uniref:ribbon-helix-helix domain-containing protein n=1 Tax=Tepidimonas taiwanensis TaxID=307486 RepID=UPI000B2DF9B9|nr:CopG family transcriptional regulator [Tepidimonas taiwanensis]
MMTTGGVQMRTTIDLEPDVLEAAKELARQQNTAVGKVISRLVRQALTGTATAVASRGGGAATSVAGFVPFPPRGTVVTNALIDRLRDAEGV